MRSKIHFICRDSLGLRCIDSRENIYESQAWLLSPAEVEALEGGRVILHQTKARLSYFAGDIVSLAPVEGDEAEETGRRRHVLTVRSTLEGRNVPWDKAGRSKGMAWTTGVMPLAEG